MSKQKKYNEVTKIYEIITNNNDDKNLYDIIRDNIENKDNEISTIHEVIKKLSNKYEIEDVNPLKIKEI